MTEDFALLTPSQLLAIERACDEYEQLIAECYGNHCTNSDETIALPNWERFVSRVSSELQSVLARELERIQQEWLNSFATMRQRATEKSSQPVQRGDERRTLLQSMVSDRFHLEFFLGCGSAGEVWRALDKQLDRKVAIKFAKHQGNLSPFCFLREARATSRLDHPNIVRVLEIDMSASFHFLVSEYVAGETLAERLRGDTPHVRQVAEWMEQLASAMAHAHAVGIVHRDLKPHNILVDDENRLRITDFGLAKDQCDEDATFTDPGTTLGTPAYMSPEQAAGGGQWNASTDIYSLGVIFYQMLTGDVPFRGTGQSILFQLLHSDPRPIAELAPGTPLELVTLCNRCLEKRPESRLSSARFLQQELERFLQGRPIQSRPVSSLNRLQKWCYRNPRLAASLASSIVLLLMLATVSTAAAWLLNRSWYIERNLRVQSEVAESKTRESLERESRALRLAQWESQTRQEAIRFLESMLESTDPTLALFASPDAQGSRPVELKDVLQKAANRVDSEWTSQPLVQARLLDIIGNAYRAAGELDRAQVLLDRAFLVANQVSGQEPGSIAMGQADEDRASHLFYMACLKHDQGDWMSAETLYKSAHERFLSLEPRAPLRLADVEFQLGRLCMDRLQGDEGSQWLKKSLDHRLEVLPASASVVRATRIALLLCHQRGEFTDIASLSKELEATDGWATELAQHYSAVLASRLTTNTYHTQLLFESLLKKLETNLTDRHPVYLLALGDYVAWLERVGNYREAWGQASRLVVLGDSIAPRHPKLIMVKIELASELLRSTHFDKAFDLFSSVDSILHADPTEHENARTTVSKSLKRELTYGYAWCLFERGQKTEAFERIKKEWESQQENVSFDSAWAAYSYARIQQNLGEDASVSQFDQRATEILIKIGSVPESPAMAEKMAIIMQHAGLLDEAERYLEAALSKEQRLRPSGHPKVADRLLALGRLLVRSENWTDAEKRLASAVEIYRNTMPTDDHRLQEAVRLWEQAKTAVEALVAP